MSAKSLTSLLLVSLFVAQLKPARAQRLYTFPLGVEAYTYRHMFPKDVAATLDTIKALGFTEMEGGVPQGLTAEAYRKMLDQRGIKMPATGAGYEQIVADPMSVVTTAKALGASYVMVAWIPHQKGNFTLDNAKKAVADFNRVGKILKDNGLTFCYHDHGYEFQPYQNGTLLDYIIQNTDPRYVSFEMDILWTQFGGGDPVALLTKYGNRWKLMHLKDLKKGVKGDLTGGTPPENDVVLGEGQLDMPAILKAAKTIGIRHYFIEDESNHEDVQVPKSIAYLRSLK